MAERIPETIVAIATPLGQGGLGVIRLSGSSSFSILSAVFIPSTDFSRTPSHTLHHGWIGSPDKKIDEVVVSLFRNPRSYTGEDVVEISCHGSPAVLKEVVDLCQIHGARPARPGEFTERAFLNGKMDLAQAEAVADLISAGSTEARKAAADQLRGELSTRIKAIRQPLIELLAQMEANLDFVEEAIPNLPSDELRGGLQKIKKQIEDLLSTSLRGRMIREGIRTVLVGRPNVGKSSLFNALLAQDRAIVTDLPGTTRDTIEEKIEWNHLSVVLTDTAGLRETSNSVEKLGTERTQRSLELADIALVILDGSEELTAEDHAILSGLKNKKAIAVLNKSDKPNKLSKNSIQSFAQQIPMVSVSALSGAGLTELKEAVLRIVSTGPKEIENAPLVTNLRHVGHLEGAKRKIEEALQSLKASRTEESLSIDLRAALQELGAITGEEITEDVLSSIFARFCIGK